ncbi:hypothetical protein ACVIJW_005655 [Bradyrhizobium barranii subsp. barranii]
MRPMPPTVAKKASEFCSREASMVSPCPVRSKMLST